MEAQGELEVSRAPCSPQHWPIVYVDIAGDSHRASGHVNAIRTVGHLAMFPRLSLQLPGLDQGTLLL